MQVARFFSLNTGLKMPSIGLGTYLLKGDALKEALDYAIFLGYRHIDTAINYDNDVEIGEVLSDILKDGKLQRKDLFITTKIQNLYFEKKEIHDRVQQTRENLKLKHLDMLLLHHPWEVTFKDYSKKNTPEAELVLAPYIDFCHTWKAFEPLVSDGTTSCIGLSNFTAKQIGRLLNVAKIPPSNVQLEAHVYYQQKKLKQYCHDHNIVVSAYAPLGSPNRPSRHVSGNESVLTEPLIIEIANAHQKTPAQVLLNFLLKSGIVVLPKSANKERMKENLGCLDWSLSDEDCRKIQELDRGLRFFKFHYMRGHPEYFEDEEW